jgi:ribosomal protein L7Ae-like RNA K-turn-binding protein
MKMSSSKQVYNLLGLCQKAGKLVSGEFALKQAVLDKQVFFVIVAQDASNNTKKLFKDKTSYRGIACVEWGIKDGLARAIGKEMRAAVGITDEKLAKKIKELIEFEETKGE